MYESYCAEERDDRVVFPSEIELGHVGPVKDYVRMFLSSDLQHVWVNIESFDGINSFEVLYVVASSTCDIK